jgi:hypothetical protein
MSDVLVLQSASKTPGSEMGIQPQQVPNWGHFSSCPSLLAVSAAGMEAY